jgi:hypothetical protein
MEIRTEHKNEIQNMHKISQDDIFFSHQDVRTLLRS